MWNEIRDGRIIIQIKKHLDDFSEIDLYQDRYFFSNVDAFSKNPEAKTKIDASV